MEKCGQHYPKFMSMGDYRASNSHMHSPFCPKIELVQDFVAVLITCISNEDSFRMSGHFPKYMGPSRAGDSHVKSIKSANI